MDIGLRLFTRFSPFNIINIQIKMNSPRPSSVPVALLVGNSLCKVVFMFP